MRINSLEILAITALFVNFVARDVKTENAIESSIDNATSVTNTSSKSGAGSKTNSSTKTRMDFWMRKMGSLQDDLINVQAIIVKDEDLSGNCGPARRKSDKRYLMCAGSMLNRNYVLTSATCVHEATHIRHNVHAPLAVVIAPLKKTMQVIPVIKYLIHPNHRTNPYSSAHIKHNIAILTLSCRIDMENYQKIELPPLPMSQICSEENCIVAVFRKTGKINHVMFQMLAPDMPYSTRRRKETSVRDVELYTSREYGRSEIIDGSVHLERPKRKLAEPPNFIGTYDSQMIFDDFPTNSTIDEQTENSTTKETTAVSTANDNISSTVETSLQDEVSKALREPEVADEPVKSFVVRSSEWYLPCAHTGSPVLLNRTQTALVAIPCNGRQPKSKWYYTDLFDNADWIRQVLNEPPPWEPVTSPAPSGNSSGCSTCIFNFFIELGCKDKGTCDKNGTIIHGGHPPGQVTGNLPRPVPPNSHGQGPFNPPVKVPPNRGSGPILPNPHGPVPPYPPGPVPPYPPSQVPPYPPGPVPPYPPSQVPPKPPGQVPTGQIPPNPPGQVSPNPPGKIPSNPPGQVPPYPPGQVPSNPPGPVPPYLPDQAPPISPDKVRPYSSGEVPSYSSGEVPSGEGLLTVVGRRKMPGCTRNSVGVELGPDCSKKDKESNIRPIYRTKSVRPINGVGKMKHLPPPNNAVGYVPQLQKPVTVRTFESLYRDYFFDKAKYPVKYNTGIGARPQNYKKPSSRHFHRERASNEIGLQNIEGDPTDWFSEVEKSLELNSQVKRQLVKARSNSN